jgi:hypothetical protein
MPERIMNNPEEQRRVARTKVKWTVAVDNKSKAGVRNWRTEAKNRDGCPRTTSGCGTT